MEFCITADELRAALKDMEEAEKNGFSHSLAVFRLRVAGEMLCDVRAYHPPGDIWAKAHPTDGSMDWGRQGAHHTHQVVHGELKRIPEAT